jgi:hypothetical protein
MNGSFVRWRAFDAESNPLTWWCDWATVEFYYHAGAVLIRTNLRGEIQ